MKKIITMENGRRKVLSMPEGESRTQQQFTDDTDVNKIMKKYKQVGAITHLNSKTGVYADFTEIGSYESSLQKVIDANKAFLGLPSTIRNRFSNNPQYLIDFLKDPKNHEESIKLGLRIPPEKAKDDSPTPQS